MKHHQGQFPRRTGHSCGGVTLRSTQAGADKRARSYRRRRAEQSSCGQRRPGCQAQHDVQRSAPPVSLRPPAPAASPGVAGTTGRGPCGSVSSRSTTGATSSASRAPAPTCSRVTALMVARTQGSGRAARVAATLVKSMAGMSSVKETCSRASTDCQPRFQPGYQSCHLPTGTCCSGLAGNRAGGAADAPYVLPPTRLSTLAVLAGSCPVFSSQPTSAHTMASLAEAPVARAGQAEWKHEGAEQTSTQAGRSLGAEHVPMLP